MTCSLISKPWSRGRLRTFLFVLGIVALRLALIHPSIGSLREKLLVSLSKLLGQAQYTPISSLYLFSEDPERVCSIRSCWKPCTGPTFTYHEFDLSILRNKLSKGLFSPELQFGRTSEESRRTTHVSAPNEACLRIVSSVPCLSAQRNNFFELLPEAVGGPNIWRNGENVLIVSQCDESIDLNARRKYLGKAAIAQNHCLRNNFIPEFDLSLPLVPRVKIREQSRHDKIFGNRRYMLTFKGSTYAKRPPPPVSYKHPPAPPKLGQHRSKLKALHDPARGIIIALRCLDRELHFFPESSNCSNWNREFGDYDYVDLLNSTFALIPGGRSPGTYRLTEALMAGSIPVFVDQFDDRAYVRPLDGIVPWELMSIRIPASLIHTLIPTLLRWSREDIVAARERGTETAETFLIPYESWVFKTYMNRLFFGTSL